MYRTKSVRRTGRLLAVLLCISMFNWTAADPVQAVGKTTVAVSKRTKTTAELSIKKISGVTGYQVFISHTRKGKYQQIGATRSSVFKLSRLGKNKIYYVKVRAYKTSASRIVTGKYSGVTKIGKYVTVTTADKYAAQVLELVNEERAKENLPALKASEALNKAANIRAKELLTENSPNRPDGRNGCSVLTDEEIVYESAGENIASGCKTPKDVVGKWMQDAGHRAQIMSSDYTYMGVGYYETAKGEKYYWSQLFIN